LRQHDFQGCPLHSTSLPKVGWVPPLAVAAKRLGGWAAQGAPEANECYLTQNAFVNTYTCAVWTVRRPHTKWHGS
jgi:hypothetical protein